MKYLTLLATIICLFNSCKKDKEDQSIPVFAPGDQKTGLFECKRNGEAIKGTAYAVFHVNNHSLIGISMTTYSAVGELREVIAFNWIPVKIGQYPIDRFYNDSVGVVGSAYGIMGSDGDVGAAFYNPDLQLGGVLELTKVDTFAKEVQGTITRAGFLRSSFPPADDFPEKVNFTKMTFSMKITN